jgi:hypothetical protein
MHSPYDVISPPQERPPAWPYGWPLSVAVVLAATTISSYETLRNMRARMDRGSGRDWVDISQYLLFADTGFMMCGIALAFVLRCTRAEHTSYVSATSLWAVISGVYTVAYVVAHSPFKGVSDVGGIVIAATYPFCTVLMFVSALRLVRQPAFRKASHDRLVVFCDSLAICVLAFHGCVWGVLFTVPLFG